jgi:membrane fusion protein (multidrug efflux system)
VSCRFPRAQTDAPCFRAGAKARASLLPLLAAASWLLAGCEHALPKEAPAAPPRAVEEAAVDVEVAVLERGAIAQPLLVAGSVVARRESRIGPDVSGRIVHVHVAVGDRVEAGAPLFEIDRIPFEIALRQAQAGCELARAQREQVAADVRRAEALRNHDVLAHQEIERLRTKLAVAIAEERQADEAAGLARLNLERTVVRAPYAGSVADRLADEGTTALLQPQTVVLVLQETDELEAHAAIPESQMELVRVGDLALVRIEGAGEAVRTRVSSVSATIDPATRTYLVKMPVPNRDHAIKAGVFAHVEIEPRTKPDVVLAPREAIRVEEGRARLLVVRQGRAELVPIEVGSATERDAEIVSGADVGEVAIVGESARTIARGMPVRVVAREAGRRS